MNPYRQIPIGRGLLRPSLRRRPAVIPGRVVRSLVGTPMLKVGVDQVARIAPLSLRDQHVLHGYDETLGFSLKPPKWLRKAQPGKLIKKLAVPLAITGALFIPGVAPAALAVGKTVGGALLTGAKVGGSAVARLFSSKKLPTKALAQAAAQPFVAPQPVTTGAATPYDMAAPADASSYQAAPMMAAAGGGDALEASSEQPAQAGGPGMGLVLAGVGVVALLAMSRRKR